MVLVDRERKMDSRTENTFFSGIARVVETETSEEVMSSGKESSKDDVT